MGTFTGPSKLTATNSEIITNIVFGHCALTVDGITTWQAKEAWTPWMTLRVQRNMTPEGHKTISPGDSITDQHALSNTI